VNRRKVKTKKTIKQKIRDTLIGLGIASIVAYPTFVGAGALYYSTSRFTSLQTPQRIESLHEYTYPNNDDCVMVVVKRVGDDNNKFPQYNSFFDLITIPEAEKTVTDGARIVIDRKISFYHEIGHKLYRDMDTDTRDIINENCEDIIKSAKNKEAVYHYLVSKSTQLNQRKSRGEKGLENILIELNMDLIRYGGRTTEEGNAVWIIKQFYNNPEELYATKLQVDLGGDLSPHLGYLSTIIKSGYDEKLHNKPIIFYADIKNFFKIYKNMFTEGLQSIHRYFVK